MLLIITCMILGPRPQKKEMVSDPWIKGIWQIALILLWKYLVIKGGASYTMSKGSGFHSFFQIPSLEN